MSAYGTGAPSYESADLQKAAIEGRLEVAVATSRAFEREGDRRRAAQWRVICDELLDRLLEVRGR